jgi:hypothetical protein
MGLMLRMSRLNDARDKTPALKFKGALELDVKEGSERDLDKDQCVCNIEQLTVEHGQPVFYAIKKGGTIYDLLCSPHILSVEDVITGHVLRIGSSSTDANKYK